LSAQVFNARITGTLKDATGSNIPGATVTAKQIETNQSKTAESDANGLYIIPLLLPGTYEVTVEAKGFQPVIRRDVILGANQTATLDFDLNVAQVTTAVDVTSDVPLLQTEQSNLAATVDTKTVDEFPLLQRDVMGLLRAVPGVVTRGQVGDARGGRGVFNSNFSVGGGRTSSNEVLIDGAVNTIGDFNGSGISMPPDSVQEFRVETSAFSAEYGRTGGGVVNQVTKGGTNQYHGSAYYYHQNEAFNANSFINNRFGTPRAILKRHQYGYSFGGPVIIPGLYNGKNKTFFFSTWEGRRDRDPVQGVFSVPTAAELRGDFSNTVFLSGSTPTRITIYDPNTGAANRVRQPFAGNVIPPDRINKIAARVLSEFPQPNRPGSSITNRGNYQFQDARSYERDIFSQRVDQYISDKHRLFGRYSWVGSIEALPSKIVRFTNTNDTIDHFKNLALDDTYQLTPRLSSSFRYAYVRYRANLQSKTVGFDPTTLGLPNYVRDSATILIYPNFNFNEGEFPNIGGTAYNNQPRDTHGVTEQLLYVRGKHAMKFGGEYRLYRFYPFQTTNPTGSYNFGRAFTQADQLAASTPAQGFGLASMLLGFGNFSYEKIQALSIYHHYWAGYFQDDWKVTSRLTFNLGLRWDTETGTAESHNRLSYFDPEASNPITATGGPKGAIQFTGNGNPTTLREANMANFAPRFGFAYRVTDRTVLRGGYGLFFLPLGLESAIVSTPYNYTLSADVFNLPNYSPKTTLSDPFPGGITTPGSSIPPTDGSYGMGINGGPVLNLNTVLRKQDPPYMQTWNFVIGRQLARTTVIDATYFGSRGVHLQIPTMALNQLDANNLVLGSALNDRVANPWAGRFTSGLLSQATIPRMQLLKPYPLFGGPTTANAYGNTMIFFRPPVGDSIYHAATFRFERRFTKGFSINAHYTISKLLDTGGAGNGAAFLDPSALRDVNNRRLERSVGSFDVPQRLVVMYSVDLPFGKGKQFFNDVPKWTNMIIGGWNLFSFHTWERGLPINVGTTDLSRLAGDGPSRVTVQPGVDPKYSLDQSIANARDFNPACQCTQPWFNPAAFTVNREFVVPNGPRFLPNIRQGNLVNWDMSLYKSLAITERFRFQLQARAFNLLNQTRFTGPTVINPASANFGSAGTEAGNPRRLEIGARVTF
jgi:outer membrane receptor protein involved in Fe transport